VDKDSALIASVVRSGRFRIKAPQTLNRESDCVFPAKEPGVPPPKLFSSGRNERGEHTLFRRLAGCSPSCTESQPWLPTSPS
jgi:hypothetical protein